ncbi:hypothetical protein RQP46_004913 [Phenoliferia psychrophenolica]
MTNTGPQYSEHFDIPYPGAETERQSLDLYLPPHATAESPLLVYVHGGAWRSEAKEDFRQTLAPFLITATSLPLAVLEYRLAPASPHPAQINDVLAGLALLSSSALFSQEDGTQRWTRSNIILIGHSAGAFMAASVVLAPPKDVRPAFAVSSAVRSAVSGIICVDAIFDLPDLLDEYPTYGSAFVDGAFGTDPNTLAAESPARWTFVSRTEGGRRALRIFVLHSREDELLTLRQPNLFVEKIKKLLEVDGGAAELEVDYETLKGSHDDVVKREELPKAVGAWIQAGKCKGAVGANLH